MSKINVYSLFLAYSLLFLDLPAYGFGLTLGTPTYSGAASGNATYQAQLNALSNSIINQFNTVIAPESNQSRFLGAIGNANADSTRSYLSPGVITESTQVAVSASGSLALSQGSGSASLSNRALPANSLPPYGLGAKTGITLGISGRALKLPTGLDPNRTMYSISFFSTDLSNLAGHGITLKSTQFSVGGSYQLYPSQNWVPMIRFNGIRITSGLSYSTFTAGYSTPFNLTQTDSTTNSSMAWNNQVNLGVQSNIYSFTNEAVTGVRLFWIWDLYTGLGLDFNAGSSQITGGSAGTLVGSQGGTTVYSAPTVFDGNSNSYSPTFAQLRYLIGTQISLGGVGVFAQASISSPSTLGLNFGAHFLF